MQLHLICFLCAFNANWKLVRVAVVWKEKVLIGGKHTTSRRDKSFLFRITPYLQDLLQQDDKRSFEKPSHYSGTNQNKSALFLVRASNERAGGQLQMDCGRWQHWSLMRSRSFRTVDAASSHLFLVRIQRQLKTSSSCSCLERKGLNRSQAYYQQTRQVLLVPDHPIPPGSSATRWQKELWEAFALQWHEPKQVRILGDDSTNVISEQLMQLYLIFHLLQIQHQLETSSSCNLNNYQEQYQQTRRVLLVLISPHLKCRRICCPEASNCFCTKLTKGSSIGWAVRLGCVSHSLNILHLSHATAAPLLSFIYSVKGLQTGLKFVMKCAVSEEEKLRQIWKGLGAHKTSPSCSDQPTP